jgi:antitoxin HicB
MRPELKSVRAIKTTLEMFMSKRYTVSDGKLVLNLDEAEEGGYIVTSPLNPELITQAETIEEAFANARDADKALKQSRAKLRESICNLAPGEELIVRKGQRPVTKVVGRGVPARKPRIAGSAKGKLVVLVEDDEHLKDFEEYIG